jgi:hypothetical protein
MTKHVLATLITLGLPALMPAGLAAQQSQSAPPAKELSSLLTQRKLDCIATRDPVEQDRFTAALFFPGAQLLVVSARYAAPSLLAEKLSKQQCRDIYADLQGAPIVESKLFFQDLGADGLHAGGENVDVLYEKGVTQTIFDGRKRKLSDTVYADKFTEADARYSRFLTSLIEEAAKAERREP